MSKTCKLIDLKTEMPTNYSEDLRWRAVWLYAIRSKAYQEIADLLFMSERSVRRYVDLYMSTGGVEASEYRHGPQQLLSDFEQLTVLQSLVNKPTIYLEELQKDLNEATGTSVSLATICRTVHRLGFTRKRVKKIALQQSDNLRAKYMAEISVFFARNACLGG